MYGSCIIIGSSRSKGQDVKKQESTMKISKIFKKLNIANLLNLRDAINNRLLDSSVIDFTSLPTFGGETPDDTAGVFSWDARNLLLVDGSTATIVSRDY